ncbi:MAG: LysR family transcriptional regulator [SAR86 cluster bacterium]|uniref:LysR family transcriptional regulator n=1 Tax=SAR86 cluster bacterium TaxID=2030880 RepID=A0A2A4WY97_9GAMM|nr:MAG: LysR family transcriptional regulator [SAR86 cluster bacterium]
MTVFAGVVEEGGFSAAARSLKLSPPAVTRAVAALEESIGVKLLNRTTRYVRPTEAGLRYLEDVKRILAEVKAADEAVAGINSEPQGHLSITAPVLFGQMFVMPGIVEYLNQNPRTEVDAVFLDRVVNLIEEGLDVGIRIGELPDSSMRALRVGNVRLVVCASPDYLARTSLPQVPEDIKLHDFVASSAGNFGREIQFASEKGARSIRVKPRLTVTTNTAAIEAAVNGFGLTRVVSYQISNYLADGKLKIVLENFELPALPVHIVHREGRWASTKVRAFIDLMAKRLRENPVLN